MKPKFFLLLVLSVCTLSVIVPAGAATAIVSDAFSGSNNAAINGRFPDGINLTGRAYVSDGIGQMSLDATLGNLKPAVNTGQNGTMYIDISSNPGKSYTKSSLLTLTADIELLNTSNDAVEPRGIGLGFFSGPTSAGEDGSTHFTGLRIKTDGTLNFVLGGVASGSISVPASTSFPTGWVPANFYTLTYTVDTTTGSITNVNLNGHDETSTFSGVTAGDFFDHSTNLAGIYDSSAGGSGLVDNFSVGVPEPSTWATLLGSAGIFAAFRRFRSGNGSVRLPRRTYEMWADDELLRHDAKSPQWAAFTHHLPQDEKQPRDVVGVGGKLRDANRQMSADPLPIRCWSSPMKVPFLTFAAMLFLPLHLHADGAGPFTQQDVQRMLEMKTPESAIIEKVKGAGVAFVSGVEDVARLKKAGASDALISAMVMARNAPVPRKYADILKPIPQQTMLKLLSANKEQAAMDISKALVSEIGRADTYRVKVDSVDRSQFPRENLIGWRVHANDEKVRVGSLNIAIEVYVYIRADPTGVMDKLKRGQILLATGTANACNLSAKGTPTLYLHVDATSIADAPK